MVIEADFKLHKGVIEMILYINFKGAQGKETADEFSPESGQSPREFRRYVRAMLKEYLMVDSRYYVSRRCCSNWK